MSMQQALTDRLLGAGAVTALIEDRIDWLERPQEDGLPAITLQTISEDRPQQMKGFQDLRSARVQIDIWALKYGETKEITEAVVSALAPSALLGGVQFGRSFVESIRDLGEPTETQFIHRTTLDLIVHHQAAGE